MHDIKKNAGVTLLEALFLSVIVSIIILTSITFVQKRGEEQRRSKAIAQIQQLLNASLSYYLRVGRWPANFGALSSGVFFPSNLSKNPWGNDIIISLSTIQPVQNKLYLYTLIGDPTDAAIVAGKLPYGYITSDVSTIPPALSECTSNCYVVTSIDVPGWNLSNANAVNFASLYRNGGCVPVPVCPVDKNGVQMEPQIFVVPVQAAGNNDGNLNAYPISSFTAFATGPVDYTTGNLNSGPPSCNPDQSVRFWSRACFADASSGNATQVASGKYWRVCLSIMTEKGLVKPLAPNTTATWWGRSTGSVLAIVRCQPKGEDIGSDFSVWGR